MSELKGFGTKPNGEKVDINSPEFNLQEYSSVTITEEMSRDEVIARYPKAVSIIHE